MYTHRNVPFRHALGVWWLSIALAPAVEAQSVQVIGDNGGKTCYRAAELAVSTHVASKDDVAACTRFLAQDRITKSDRAAALVNRGILEMAAGDHAAARRSYDDALQLAENRGETRINIANIYMHQARYREAVSEYTKGIPLMTRRQHVGYLNRGLAYEYLEEYEAAGADYARALNLAPQWIRAKKMLARVRLKQSP